MESALRIQEQLEIDKLNCVYDQTIYVKAVEIQLKESENSLVFFNDGEISHTFNVSWDYRHKF